MRLTRYAYGLIVLALSSGCSSDPDDTAGRDGGENNASGGSGNVNDGGSGNDGNNGGGSTSTGGANGGSGAANGTGGSDPGPSCGFDVCPEVVTCPSGEYVDAALISGLEDPDGVDKNWWVQNHGTVTDLSPPANQGNFVTSEGGADGTSMAAHITGNMTAPFVLLHANPGPNNTGLGFDASEYAGISFWAKVGDTPDAISAVRLRVPDKNTWPNAGICDKCLHDAHSKPILLTNEWKQYTIPFEEMVPNSPGSPSQPHVDPSGLYHIYWVVNGTGPIDLWVDQLSYMKCK